LLDRLALEIKAMVLLAGSESELKARLDGRLTNSHDESIQKFIEAVQTRAVPTVWQLLFIALGELVLASFLVILGTVALVPALVGINTPEGLLQYLADSARATVGSASLAQYAPVIGFVGGTLLILSAFYTLRQAALSLKKAGFSVKSGEV